MGRSALAVLSTEALLHNVAALRKCAPQSRILAMVKANAYGHGIRSVSLRLGKYVDYLGVASIDEALAVRKVGVRTPIVLMEGVNDPDEFLIASCENFAIVFHHEQQVAWLETLSWVRPVQAWLKIDTGMGRLGVMPSEVPALFTRLSNSSAIQHPLGLMSHLACADTPRHELNDQQLRLFEQVTAGYPGLRSMCASAGIFSFPQYHYDVVRPGLALYGINPLASPLPVDLQPVMTLQTRLIATRRVARGTSIGYGARFICSEDMNIGVIAMGYGDGLPRSIKDGTPVVVKGRQCSFVGRVSMDMATVDLRNCPEAQIGDQVILWGQGLPLENVAGYSGLSAYELLTGVQPRVRFHWTLPC